MRLKAIKNHILFKFCDEVRNKAFTNKTDWNFEILARTDDVKYPRWAEVLHAGPDVVSEIKEGKFILIEPLKWTTEVTVLGKSYWMTNDSHVWAVSDQRV